jgi:START domain
MLRLTVVLALTLAAAAPGAARAAGWTVVGQKDGITVTTREVAGRDFPTFRGVGVVHGNLFQVLAVLSDIKRHPEWLERAKDVRLVRKINELEYVVYGRTDAPWPVSDRDAVYQSKTHVDLSKMTVTIRFWAARDRRVPRRDGVVRMEKLRGHYRFIALGQHKTRVTYQVDADPGGLLPTWLAARATRWLPLRTLQGLRRQVKRTKGWYGARIKKWKAGGY